MSDLPKTVKGQYEKTLANIRDSDHDNADALSAILYLVGEGDKKNDKRFGTLFELVKEIKDTQDEQARNTEKLAVELHSIKTVITGNPEYDQPGVIDQMKDLKRDQVDQKKKLEELDRKQWKMGVYYGMAVLVLGWVLSNWEKVFN